MRDHGRTERGSTFRSTRRVATRNGRGGVILVALLKALIQTTKKGLALVVLVTVFAVWLGVACSHEAKSLGEAAIRNAAAVEAAKRFKDAGYPIEGGLDCTSSIDDHHVVVRCTGKTTRGEAVTAVGLGVAANHNTALKGSWTGTVTGRRVFTQSCIGPTC